MRHRLRRLHWWSWFGVAFSLLVYVHLIPFRLYGVDELEHMHTAFSLANGFLPYRDFFEHHGPLTYLIAFPSTKLLGSSLVNLTTNRILSLFFVLVTAVGTWKVSRQVFGRQAGPMGLLWMVTFSGFVDSSVEWRPDVIAMAMMIWATWFALRGTGNLQTNFFLAGLLIGLASLCTQKIVFVSFGLTIGLAIYLKRRSIGLWRPGLAAVLGATLPWAGILSWLFAYGAAGSFLKCYFYYPLIWEVGTYGVTFFDRLFSRQTWTPLHQALAVFALVWGVLRLKSGRCLERGESVLLIAALVHLLASFGPKPTYPHYFLLAMPHLAILTGGLTMAFWNGMAMRFAKKSTAERLAPLLIWCSAFYALGVALRAALDHPWTFGRTGQVSLFLSLLGLALFLGTVYLSRHHKPALVAGALLVWALAMPSMWRLAVPHIAWSNRGDLADLRTVMKLTSPDQIVQDGFTGLGCLRPHNYYWRWIQVHTMPFLKQEDRLGDLRRSLEEGRPALVILDGNIRNLYSVFGSALESNYRSVSTLSNGRTELLLRRDLPQPEHEP